MIDVETFGAAKAYTDAQGGGGGGGTTVVANPSGEATDDLEKLQVGSTVYAVNGGGNTFSLNGERLIIS